MASSTAPKFTDPRKYQEWSVALAVCSAFRRHDLRFQSAPDDGAGAGSTALPDFVFIDAKSRDYWNVEVKRLVPQHIRRQYEFVRSRLSACLDGVVPGVFTCEIQLNAVDPEALVSLRELDVVIDYVAATSMAAGTLPDQVEPLPGYRIRRVNTVGSHVEPWLWDFELEPRSVRAAAATQLLRNEFHRHLANARDKFDNLPAARNVVVFETRGTLLDRTHMLGPFADGPDLLSQLDMSAAADGWTAVDTVVIDPHINVQNLDSEGSAQPAHTVMTGTIYSADTPYTPLGTMVRLWPGGCPDFVGLRRGEPNLMRQSDCSCERC